MERHMGMESLMGYTEGLISPPTQQLKGEGKHKLTGEAFFRAVSDIPFLQLQRFYSDALPARAGVSRDVDLSVSAALTATHFSAKPTVKRR